MPFPWQVVIRFGLGFLRLNPASFWQMSLREIFEAMAFYQPEPIDRPNRDDLAELATRYPDK